MRSWLLHLTRARHATICRSDSRLDCSKARGLKQRRGHTSRIINQVTFTALLVYMCTCRRQSRTQATHLSTCQLLGHDILSVNSLQPSMRPSFTRNLIQSVAPTEDAATYCWPCEERPFCRGISGRALRLASAARPASCCWGPSSGRVPALRAASAARCAARAVAELRLLA